MALYNRKLTPEVQATIVHCLENGLSIAGACGQAKISKTCFYDWWNAGKEAKTGKKREFYCAVENAKDVAQSNFETIITNATSDSWQAAAWWLERRRPEMYRKQEKHYHDANLKGDVTVNKFEEIKKNREALNDIRRKRRGVNTS